VLDAVASLVTRRPRWIVAAAAAFGIVALAFGGRVAQALAPFGFDDPATESVKARNTVERVAGYDPDLVLVAIVQPFTRSEVERTAAALEKEPTVRARPHRLPDARPGHDLARQAGNVRPGALPPAGRSGTRQDREANRRSSSRTTTTCSSGGGVIGFEQVGRIVEEDLLRAELIAFPLLLLLAFWVFRGFVAALLPPFVGGLTILLSFLGLRIATEITPLSVFSLNLVDRHGPRARHRLEPARPSRATGRSSMPAATPSAARSRRPDARRLQRTDRRSGHGIAARVPAALPVLDGRRRRARRARRRNRLARCAPAVLALLGRRVDALAPQRWQRNAARPGEGAWYRFSRFVMRRAGIVAAVSAIALIAFGLPFLRVHFTAADSRVLPPSSSARVVFERLTNDFGQTTTPFYAVVRGDRRDAAAFAARVQALRGVARVRPQPLSRNVWKLDVVTDVDYLSGDAGARPRDPRLPTPLTVQVAAARPASPTRRRA
jgi:RND superfamily putative drug exporter